MKIIRGSLVSFFALLLFACTPAAQTLGPSPQAALTATFTRVLPSATFPPPAPTTAPSPTPQPRAKRVLIISIDGLRPDGLLRSNIPRISTLINGGASSFTAQTIFPSVTLPAHASMLSGRCVSQHGIDWNDYLPEKGFIQGATVFSVAHDAGMRTLMVVGKEKLVTIARPGTVDEFDVPSGTDEQIVRAAIKDAAGGFGVMFVHLLLPDYFGHLVGWMTPDYFAGIARDDANVGTLLDGLREEGLMDGTLVILTADHGGHDQSHGSLDPQDMTIPWIIFGPGVVAGQGLTVPILTTDTAATGVWALGLAVPADWVGRPVVEAFGLQAETMPVATAAAGRCLS